jgi:hypothetical protein
MKKTLLVVLMLTATVGAQQTPHKFHITVDKATIGTWSNGSHYSLIRFHEKSHQDKRFEFVCDVSHADCQPLEVGAHYDVEGLEPGDSDAYHGWTSIRIYGEEAATVYYNPHAPVK